MSKRACLVIFVGFSLMNMKFGRASLHAYKESDLLCLKVVPEIANVCAN